MKQAWSVVVGDGEQFSLVMKIVRPEVIFKLSSCRGLLGGNTSS